MNSQKIWKICKKGKLNSEMKWKKGKLNSDKIWTIWKKGKLNSEMKWKPWMKSKLKVKRYEKYGRKVS